MPYILERRQTVPRGLEETFDFYSRPGNLGKITPPWLHFELLDPSDMEVGRGTRLHYRLRALVIPQHWTSEITAWEPPRRFVDEQIAGPYRRWRHEHTLREVAGGTEVHDRVTYSLPFGLLGRLVHRLLIRRQLRAIFDYRERRVRELLGASEPHSRRAGR